MKLVAHPSFPYINLINSCIGSIDCADLRDRLQNVLPDLISAGSDYNNSATHSNLFQTVSFSGGDDEIVIGAVTKKELKKLYSAHMVPAAKPSRAFYDDIMILAPLGICPFCGFGHVKTLDHYLPKSKFPLLSIYPLNLVPCCTDCNKGKLAKTATTMGEQCLHPYFSDPLFVNEQWIFATVSHTAPAAVVYHLQRPVSWGFTDFERAKSHFDDYGLAQRFSVQAGTELSTLRGELKFDHASGGVSEVLKTLRKKESAARGVEKNSWKTAMYQALSNDAWFYEGGFNLV